MNLQPHSSASSKSSSPSRSRDSEVSERTACARFRRTSRLLRHADFQRVYKLGRRHFATNMTVFYLKHDRCTTQASPAEQAQDQRPRIGFTVGRVLGGAVDRNRIKRRMREAVRANLPSLTVPVDVVINPKKPALSVEFAILRIEVAKAFSLIQQKCSPEGTKAGSPGRSPGSRS